MDVDHDVRLLDLEALKELNDGALVSGPWKTSELDAAVNVVLSDGVATSDVLVVWVEGLELGMVLDVAIVEEDPATTDLLLLLLLESTFRIFT